MRKIFLASLVSTIILMAWGSVYWMSMPLDKLGFKPIASENNVVEVLKANLPESGVYILPYPTSDDPTDAEMVKRYIEGPVVQIFYRNPGLNPMDSKTFAMGALHSFLCSLLVVWLLYTARASLPSYLQRVGFVTVIGLVATISTEVAYPIWWQHTWDFHLMTMLEHAIAWALVGFGIAGIIKKRDI